MSITEQAVFFNSGIGASVAASFTTDRIRDEPEPSCEVSFQLIPGRLITDFELLLDCDDIVRTLRRGMISDTYDL